MCPKMKSWKIKIINKVSAPAFKKFIGKKLNAQTIWKTKNETDQANKLFFCAPGISFEISKNSLKRYRNAENAARYFTKNKIPDLSDQKNKEKIANTKTPFKKW